jgi:hypothetical protein
METFPQNQALPRISEQQAKKVLSSRLKTVKSQWASTFDSLVALSF